MSRSLLKNSGFEADWSEERAHRVLVLPVNGSPYEAELGEFHTPPGWVSWFRHDPGTWAQPKVSVVRRQNVAYRVHSGDKAARLFTSFRKHDAGFLQQVEVEPGTDIRLTAWAHAWSNHGVDGYEDCKDNPRFSCGVGKEAAFVLEDDAPPLNNDPWGDALHNFTFQVGLDPTGGIDPFAETVVWGRGAHIYNAYHEVPAVEITTQADAVTVFLRSTTMRSFKHNYAYWDDVRLNPVRGGSSKDQSEASSGMSTEHVPPRQPYRRTYILLPQGQERYEHLEWRVGAAIGSSEKMRTIGHSADDAGVGPRDREIVAVNPEMWGWDLKAWYDEYYPGAEYREVLTASPWEMAINLQPLLEEDIALAQIDPRWGDYDFGEHPDPVGGAETIRRYGCFLTGLAIMLRKIYQRDVTPPLLDKLLVADRAGYVADNLMAWHGAMSLFPAFDDSIKENGQWPARELKGLLEDRWEIILMRADGAHFVYLEEVKDDTLHIIDTWDGERKQKLPSNYGGIRAAHVKRPVSTPLRNESGEGALPPREPYKRSYVLLPQLSDIVERCEWRAAAAIGSSDRMQTIGHSADDAGVGPRDREVIAVNPEEWEADLKEWYDEHYSGVDFKEICTDSPWEMALRLLPISNEDIALAQTDPRWADRDFGEHPDRPEDGETIGQYGSFLTGLTIMLRKIYQRDVTPPLLDKILVMGRKAYFDDNLIAWHGAASLFPAFDDSIKDNKQRSARELGSLLKGGWEIILRHADGSPFVYLEDVRGDTLHIIDTQDGERKRKEAAQYQGIRATHLKKQPPPPPPTPDEVLVGLHDEGGGEWMADQGIQGCCLAHWVVQQHPVQIDCRHLQDAGITVIARLNWGYADGTGTLPRPENRGGFIDAVVKTILSSKGIDYFHVGNEPNNRQEWPGFGTDDEFALTADYVTGIHNEIWQRVNGRAKMGPPPLDPYCGPGSNNRDWWMHFLNKSTDADALFLHAKTQTNNPVDVRSRERFGDDPLTWQYKHLKAVETYLAVVPERFRSLPVFVAELNPQFRNAVGGETGWLPDNDTWVHEALRYFREEQPVNGVMFYRYEVAGDQAPFGLKDKPSILDAIKEEAARSFTKMAS